MKLSGSPFGKSTYKKGSGFSKGPSRAAPVVSPFTATPETYAPPAPSTYGGPAGSFITRGRTCPAGYSTVPLPRVGNSPAEYRCVPKPRPVQVPVSPSAPSSPLPPVTVSPPITVSPVMTQTFTPQISPVFQQVQDSPGASQSAAPVQDVDSTQKAVTSGPIVQPVEIPAPMVPVVAMPEPAPSVAEPSYSPPIEAPTPIIAEQAGSDLPILLGIGAIALYAFTKS